MDWQQLAIFFPDTMLEWRIVELAQDKSQALVRPQLILSEVRSHLDAVATRQGWSNSFYAVGHHALGCALSVAGVVKSVVLPLSYPNMQGNAAQRANDALVQAAECFGILPEVDVSMRYWVEVDADALTILHEPTEVQRYPNILPQSYTTEKELQLDARPLNTGDTPLKPSGQMIIDKLLERLKTEGLGLEAAKLVIHHKGYGDDAEEAKRLYGKLRTLLQEAN